MLHPIFALILCGNIIEVATLIQNDPEAFRVKHDGWYNSSPLVFASNYGRVKICKLLLDNGASVHEVNDWKMTALHVCCQEGHLELAKLLLQHGASIHKVDKNNRTPLHLAAQSGHDDILAWILDNYNFDMKMKDFQGYTILHIAAVFGQSDCCSVILRHHPDINVKDDNGNTPLAGACQAGDIGMVRVLLQHGARVSYNQNGSTALHKAAIKNHADVVEMMVKDFHWEVNIVSIWINIEIYIKFKMYHVYNCRATARMEVLHLCLLHGGVQ